MPTTCEIIVPADESQATARVAGLSVLMRLVLGACRAGFQQITISAPNADSIVDGLRKDKRTQGMTIISDAPDIDVPRLVVEANVVISNEVWELLAQAKENLSVSIAPQLKVVGYPSDVTQEPQLGTSAYVIPVRSRAGAAIAKQAIFANVTKKTSGPVSRHLNSLISLPLSKFLCEFGVTPNQMTLLTTIIGLLSAWLISRGTFVALALAGILFQLCAALDRVDGELARSTFTASEWGAWIDTVGDNFVYLAFIVGLTVGYHEYTSSQGLAVADYVYPVGSITLILAVFLIASMGLYLKLNTKAGTMTAVQSDMAQRVDREHAGLVYRFLDAIQLLGKRDAFSLITCIIAVLPWLTGNPFGFHLLFWLALLIVILVIAYYGLGLLNIKSQ